ncbi:MAG: uracil-DNA glycosylase, partial [Ornithinibacter sp.]
MDPLDPHPVTGELFASPVPAGSGWPGDPADASTPVAQTPAAVRRLAVSATGIPELQARISVCRACPRLVRWREDVARSGRRASFADQPYWGRPGPSFGDPDAEVLLVGLAPAANGTNRTGRMFTGDSSGDVLYAALHRTGFAALPTSVAAGDGQSLTGIRIVAAVRCAPPANRPLPSERDNCLPYLVRELRLLRNAGVLVTLGSFAWDACLRALRLLDADVPRPKPRFGHGAEARAEPYVLLGCFHPS